MALKTQAYSFTQLVNQRASLFARRRNAEEQFAALVPSIRRIRMRLAKASCPNRKAKLSALLASKEDSARILASAIAEKSFPVPLDGNK